MNGLLNGMCCVIRWVTNRDRDEHAGMLANRCTSRPRHAVEGGAWISRLAISLIASESGKTLPIVPVFPTSSSGGQFTSDAAARNRSLATPASRIQAEGRTDYLGGACAERSALRVWSEPPIASKWPATW